MSGESEVCSGGSIDTYIDEALTILMDERSCEEVQMSEVARGYEEVHRTSMFEAGSPACVFDDTISELSDAVESGT